MTQQVQELIDKIKSDGVAAANSESAQILEKANQKAQQIINEAKSKAEHMINEAELQIKKQKESTEMSLKQSSRDMILSLRKNIESILNKIIHEEISDSLKPEELASIIESVITSQKGDVTSVEVTLNAKDQEKLKKGFAAKLQKKVKEPISFKSSDDIGSGFTISFDAGKSSFDFTDEALAQYLGNFLNSHVAQLVKDS